MDNHCRICRRSEGIFMESLFDMRGGHQIATVVMKVCPIEIDVTDLLPKMICEECLEIVFSAHELQTKSADSDKYFRSLFMDLNVKTEIKVELNEYDVMNYFAQDFVDANESMSDSDYDPAPQNSKKTPSLVFNVGPPGMNFHKTDMFPCNFCDIGPRSRAAMMRHMSQTHNPGSKLFPCQYCSSRFETEIARISHERTRHQGETSKKFFVCDMCGVSGTSREGIKNHKMFDHFITPQPAQRPQKSPRVPTKRGRHMCDLCGAVEKDIQDMRRHMFSEHVIALERERRARNRMVKQGLVGPPVKCGQCHESFKDTNHLRNHTLMVHENYFREVLPHEIQQCLSCCVCGDEFPMREDLLLHIEEHSSSYQPVKCQHSMVALKTYSALVKHMKYQSKPKTHECQKCKKLFPFGGKLVDHIRSHNRAYTKFHCHKCRSKFRNQKDLETHIKVKHENITLFMCPICAKSLASPGCVSTHIKTVHMKDEQKRDHECKVCLRRFAHKSHLSKHEATHKTERPHVCELCGATFKTRDGLVIHMKRHDGSLMRMQCSQCEFRCPSQHRLNVHMLTHSGAKPHQCQFCDRAYASKGDLTKHLTKVHVGNAIYKCEKCPEAFRRVVELREHLVVHAGEV